MASWPNYACVAVVVVAGAVLERRTGSLVALPLVVAAYLIGYAEGRLW
jgi:hypothetical protein